GERAGRPGWLLVQDSQETPPTRERGGADRGLPVAPTVKGDRRHPRRQALCHLAPATPVGYSLVQQHHKLGVPRPALTGQIASLPFDHDPLAHDAILIAAIGGGNALRATEWAAVTKRRPASSGLQPRDQMRAWVFAAKC